MENQNHKTAHGIPAHPNQYRKLLIMVLLSFVSMYVLMYAMVDTWGNVIPNINRFYMAGLMTSPMIVIELLLMGSMYMNKKLNSLLIALSCVALAGFYLLIRQQAAVSDKQFLKSMIPHHAGAILMGEKAKLKDPEIIELKNNIIKSQQEEINFMKAKLKSME